MAELTRRLGRLRPAPENFLSPAELKAAREGRRSFLRTSLLAAGAAASTPADGATTRARSGHRQLAALDHQPGQSGRRTTLRLAVGASQRPAAS